MPSRGSGVTVTPGSATSLAAPRGSTWTTRSAPRAPVSTQPVTVTSPSGRLAPPRPLSRPARSSAAPACPPARRTASAASGRGGSRIGSEDLLAGRFLVLDEGGEALVGERVLVEVAQQLGRQGGDVGAQTRRRDHVVGRPHRGDQHLGVEVRVVAVDLDYLGDQLHAVVADVVETAD